MLRCIATARNSTPHVAWIAAIGAALSSTGCGASGDFSRSADGLVFIREIEGSNEVVQVRLSDGAIRVLTQSPERNERWPYWSDAANRLVYQVEPSAGGNSDLMLWDPESASASPLRESAQRDERWPVWSPDGKRLAYALRGGGPVAGIASETIAGDEPTRILAVSGPKDYFYRPSYAPGGERLVAQRRGSGGEGSGLWILVPNALPTPLTSDPEFFDMKPWFTRHGDRVVFSRRKLEATKRDIVIISADGGAVGIVVDTPNADDHSGRPSPTDDQIAFCSDRSGTTNIYLIDLDERDSGPARALTQWTNRNAYAPRWSPDGQRLVVTAQPIGTSANIANAHIVVLDRNGTILLDVPGAMPDWMPPWR